MRSLNGYNMLIVSIIMITSIIFMWVEKMKAFAIVFIAIYLAMIVAALGNDFIITYREVICVKNWRRYKISWDMIENVSICRHGIATYVYTFKMSDEAKTILPPHFLPVIYATHATRKIIESNMPIHKIVP